MRVVRTNRNRGIFVIETNKPFDLLRNRGVKYIALNINHLNIKPHMLSCGHFIDRYIRPDFVEEIIEEENIPQPIKDKLKELGITE